MQDAEPAKTVSPQMRYAALVGTYHRIAGIGPIYEVVKIKDDNEAHIHLVETDESADYPIVDVLQDPDPDSGVVEDYGITPDVDMNKLQGQFRTIGPFGPLYQVLKIDGDGQATIVLLESNEEVSYPARNIYFDPEPS
jgi:hypothetical protein